jgi:hypothetical protein
MSQMIKLTLSGGPATKSVSYGNVSPFLRERVFESLRCRYANIFFLLKFFFFLRTVFVLSFGQLCLIFNTNRAYLQADIFFFTSHFTSAQ